MTFASLDDVEHALDALPRDAAPQKGWTLAQTLEHCAQSIEYSLSGYPRLRSALFRATIGPFVKRRFLRQRRLSHDRTAPIPGAPAIEESVTLRAGIERLRAAIAAFRASDQKPAPHFAYGNCNKEDYARLHALHCADHLGAFVAP